MKKRILTRANALIILLLSVLGFTGCSREYLVAYGVPEPPKPTQVAETVENEETQDIPSATDQAR